MEPRFFAAASRGTEEVLARELAQLDISPIRAVRAGVAFGSGMVDGYRACLWSRVASRVLMPLSSFEASDPDGLYEGIHTIRWTDHLGPERTLAVSVAGRHSPVGPSQFIALKTKDAIVDRVRAAEGARPDVDKRDPDVRVHVHAAGTRFTISLDLAGRGLHLRGHERPRASAPLRENLAAALLRIAGWPDQASAGPLLDPMCGSGTLLAEAAGMALDVAPGLSRERLGAEGWRQHDAGLWSRLMAEAEERRRRVMDRRIRVAGFDASRSAVRAARGYLARAGFSPYVTIDLRDLADARPLWDEAGILITNPPYGQRLGESAELGPLYEMLGDVLKRRFAGWTAWILGGSRALEKRIGLRPASKVVLFNGPIECRFLKFPISEAPPTSQRGPGWRRSGEEARGFARRLRGNARRLRPWAEREKLACYRIYDADIPLYNLSVDWYDGRVRVEEYPRPRKIPTADAERRLRDALLVVSEVLEVERRDVVLRAFGSPAAPGRSGRHGDRGRDQTVREGELLFRVNLEDHPHAGLPLDERLLRRWVYDHAEGRDFLDLFAGTCTTSVAAAAGGARSTTSVDPSPQLLDWGRGNLDLNGVASEAAHRFVRDDALHFLRGRGTRGRYGLVVVAPPPTIDRPGRLLAATRPLLDEGGEILFTSRMKPIEFRAEDRRGLAAREITDELTPRDFASRPRLRVWRMLLSDAR